MPQTPWDAGFLSSTRGRIITLLRRTSHTVEELAYALRLSDNAVRTHLVVLERDGLVQQQGVRRGSRRPAHTYALTAAARQSLSRAYVPVLRHVLDVLAERLAPSGIEDLVRAVGRRLAADNRVPNGHLDLAGRVAEAAAALDDLGGLVEVEAAADGRTFLLHSHGCPLAAVVGGHPAVCLLLESLLSELIGVPVRERCDRSDPPRCAFAVLPA